MTGLRPLRSITSIVIHCADTPNGDPRFGAADIDRWHAENGWLRPTRQRGYRDHGSSGSGQTVRPLPGGPYDHIGYHYVIEVDGTVVPGRALEEVGAHCPARNLDSIGICLVGRDKFTGAQWQSLALLVDDCASMAPTDITGHRDNIRPGDKPKTCPNFSVSAWLASGMRPLAGHICEVKR